MALEHKAKKNEPKSKCTYSHIHICTHIHKGEPELDGEGTDFFTVVALDGDLAGDGEREGKGAGVRHTHTWKERRMENVNYSNTHTIPYASRIRTCTYIHTYMNC